MIQATINTPIQIVIQTKDNRIHTTAKDFQIRHLLKFTNDMDGSVQYAYGYLETIFNRYTLIRLAWNATPNVFIGDINLLPAGYWKYEVYEVFFNTLLIPLDGRHAPATEDQTLSGATTDGVVQGLVTKGKMYVAEAAGTEEVQYTQNAKSVISVEILFGGLNYAGVPTLTFSGGGNPIAQATATCTVVGGQITSVTITNGGSGYTENPIITLTGQASTSSAQLQAEINPTNYIYTG